MDGRIHAGMDLRLAFLRPSPRPMYRYVCVQWALDTGGRVHAFTWHGDIFAC